MKSHERAQNHNIPELTLGGELYDELLQDRELDKISSELEARARASEKIENKTPEKTWAEHMSEVGKFNKEKAEDAVERDTPNPEDLEVMSTAKYEAEIMALNKFAEKADFLDEPVELPSETDLIRRWEEDRLLHTHYKEIQDWLHMKGLSDADKAYRKDFMKHGYYEGKKKLFYRPGEDIAKVWEDDKTKCVEYDRDKKISNFSKEQDEIERKIEDELEKYEPNRNGFIKYNHGRAEEMPMPSKLELVYNWVEDDKETSLERADMVLDWLESDDGDEEEKRYRALVRTKLKRPFKRLEAGYRHKLQERTAYGMSISHGYPGSERENFTDKLKVGKISTEYTELTGEEKEKKWQEAEEKYREGIIKRNELKEHEKEREREHERRRKEEEARNPRRSEEEYEAEKRKETEEEEWRKRLLDDSSSSDISSPYDFPMAG